MIDPPAGAEVLYTAGDPLPGDGGVTILRRYAHVNFVLTRPEFFSVATGSAPGDRPHLFAEGHWALGNERHDQLRALAAPYLTGSALEKVLAQVPGTFTPLFEAIREGGPGSFDLLSVARSGAFRSVCRLTGLPQDRELWMQDVVDDFVRREPPFSDFSPEPDDVRPYLAELAGQRRALGDRSPDDLLSHLIRARDGKLISEDELFGFIMMYFGAGGHTLAASIAKYFVVLAELGLLGNETYARAERQIATGQPDRVLRLLRDETDRLIPVFPFAMRMVLQQVELPGPSKLVLEAGQPLLLSYGAANRDPSVFEEPNEFRIQRGHRNMQRTFGAGARRCVGAEFAQAVELTALVSALGLLPNLRLEACELKLTTVDNIEPIFSWHE